jgi:uncharacterized protein (DUF3084 family)
LKKELTDIKESFNRIKLERDVSFQEKSVISDALSRIELQKAELELDMNKMKSEEAKLRDILLKMQSLNEGLTQDKQELNKIIQHLEHEKANLNSDKSELELMKASLKGELVKVEQEKQDLENERECKDFFHKQQKRLFELMNFNFDFCIFFFLIFCSSQS